MEPVDDSALLRQYAKDHADAAFAELVARHVNLVYSVALRQAGHPQNAEEITQAVFIILAKKAAGLRHEKALSSWLFQATRLTAINFVRSEVRRRHREQEAHMQTMLNESGSEVWPKIAPMLDDAVAALREKERRAIVLRFYEGRNLLEVGLALGASEEAAKKRVGRALEKLRQFFARRGVDSTTAAIAETISANSIMVAPAALAKITTAAALAKGATASTTTLTLTKGALKIMAWTKAKTAVVVGVAALFAASTATVAVKATFFPAIKEAYFRPMSFQNLPRGLFTLRPTRFTSPTNGFDYSAETSSPSGEHVTLFIGRNRSFEQLIAKAYGGSPPYVVYPANLPEGNFDYLCTILDSRAGEHLQEAIKRKLGCVANWRQRDTSVFLLKVKTPNSPRLKASDPSSRSFVQENSRNQLEFQNWPMWGLAHEMEISANIPVLDKTGLANLFDFNLDCSRADLQNQDWDMAKRALDELGLELVATNMNLNMLVVETEK
jgi:uncharacterized protein (TIGR03435 family)